MTTEVLILGRPRGRRFRVVNFDTKKTIESGFSSWSEAVAYAEACGFSVRPERAI